MMFCEIQNEPLFRKTISIDQFLPTRKALKKLTVQINRVAIGLSGQKNCIFLYI